MLGKVNFEYIFSNSGYFIKNLWWLGIPYWMGNRWLLFRK